MEGADDFHFHIEFFPPMRSGDKIIRMRATDLYVWVEADLSRIDDYKTLPRDNYQIGVAAELIKDGIDVSANL